MAYLGVAQDTQNQNLTMAAGKLILDSAGTSITAGTTRTQAGATPLTQQMSTVDTATAPASGTILGDGVMLLPVSAGLKQEVVNNTPYPIQVYSNTLDNPTINGIPAAAGITLPPGDAADFEGFIAGGTPRWFTEAGVGSNGNFPVELSQEGIVASATVTQAAATPLLGRICHVTTVPAAGGAVALRSSAYGIEQAVENATPNPLTVYPINGGTDAINGQAANTPVIIPGFTTALFRAASGGIIQSDPYFNGAGSFPSTGGAQPGSATTGAARSGGNLTAQVNAAGQGNGADLTDDVLFTYALPASAFDVAGRQLTITAAGKFGATANNKRIKIWIGTTTQNVGAAVAGGVLVCDSGVVTQNAGGWAASVIVQKYGAAGSNTQLASNAQVVGTTHLGAQAPVALTQVESGVINVTITGASPTTGAANDVVGQQFDVAWNN